MRPDTIVLLRHGESQANRDKSLFATIPDYAMQLTTQGRRQARAAGQQLNAMLAEGSSIQFYVSPYWRTRQTYEEVAEALKGRRQKMYEDPRLREQEWSGDFMPSLHDHEEVEERRDSYGHFYFRIRGGESCADVYDRISDFFNTLHRDFEKRDFPRNVVIVTHGMTMRVFLMRWAHMSVEAFERLANPVNCEMFVLKREPDSDHYWLVTEPRLHKLKHKFQYPGKR